MTDHRNVLHRLCARLWYSRVDLSGAAHLAAPDPILYVSLHRNGLVDGFVLREVLRTPTFMVSTQWMKHPLLRFFFDGIGVTREKDGGAAESSLASLAVCADHLASGRNLVIFPEGTSSLGPSHLPIKTGTARILDDVLARGVALTVLPVALQYERAWAFRSRVEVVLGAPVDLTVDPALTPKASMRARHDRLVQALEAVGLNVPDAPTQARVEALAYAATLGTRIRYAAALKACETDVPMALAEAWEALQQELPRHALRHQGVPLVPTGPVALYILGFLLLAPLPLAATVLNLPVVLASAWAGRTLPDDRNVIALWRLLVGVPLLGLWSLAVIVTALTTGHPAWLGLWVALSLGGLLATYRAKKLGVAVWNALTCPGLRPRLRALHAQLVAHLAGQA